MSTRSQDTQRLIQLAEQIAGLSQGLVKLVNLIKEINGDVARLRADVDGLSEQLDELERAEAPEPI
jgi:ubiquinone biosynthesis protein UbiJ